LPRYYQNQHLNPVQAKEVVILGSTGSIGTQTLDVVDRLNSAGQPIRVLGLSAGTNINVLSKQIERFSPRVVAVSQKTAAEKLKERFPALKVLFGTDGLEILASLADADLVVNALVGAIGLLPTLAALNSNHTLALANKESMVIGGELVRQVVNETNATLLPIDSEHNAIFQSMHAGKNSEIERIIITASGGPFLNTPIEKLASVNSQDALRHPNWSMGSRITIDSATMVNKAFEVIEAHYLFDVAYEKIEPVIHPQSVIHSMVEYRDGSIIAELAASDMRIPIQYAIMYPERIDTELPRLSLEELSQLSFEPLDMMRYPAFDVVLKAGICGGTAPAALNAADEVLVKSFLQGEIRYTDIANGLKKIFDLWLGREEHVRSDLLRLENIMDIDSWARKEATALRFNR